MEKFFERMVMRWVGVVCLLCDILTIVPMMIVLGLAVIFAMIFRRKSFTDIRNDGEIVEWLHITRNTIGDSIKLILTGEYSYEKNED